MSLSTGWNRFLLVSILVWAAFPAYAGEITIMGYNVANYLVMNRRVDGKSEKNAPKPESEINALVGIIAQVKPDILGLSEMGGREQLADLQSRLKAAGLDLPHSEWVQGADEERHVALLSRFPVVERNSIGNLPISVNGQATGMQRGILDATLEVSPKFNLRVLGVHLKSRRIVPEFDQAALRALEAAELRKYVEIILKKDASARFLIFGDFNDTKNEAPIKEVWGKKNSPFALHLIDFRDERGETWTHYWKVADEYSRIDYMFVSSALRPLVNAETSHIVNAPNLMDASDHRPVVLKLQTPE